MNEKRKEHGPGKLHLEELEGRLLLSASPLPDLAVEQGRSLLVRFANPDEAIHLDGVNIHAVGDPKLGIHRVSMMPGVAADSVIAQLRSDRGVAFVEKDSLARVSGLTNDPKLSQQWSLRNTGQNGVGLPGSDIRATSAWDIGKGSYRMVVAVMDSGIDYTHPDLYQNIWINQAEIPASRRSNLEDFDRDGLITLRDLNDPRNQGAGKITDLNRNGFIDAEDLLSPTVLDSSGKDTGAGGWANQISENQDDYVDDICGWNFVDDNNRPYDDLGHGTHIAGTIGAMGNNRLGIAGINWVTQMMPIKFIDGEGVGSISSYLTALDYAVRMGARLSNNSWTGDGEVEALTEAIQSAGEQGHLVIAAAGNDSSNNDLIEVYPANIPSENVVSVTATDASDRLASFSNFGAKSVELAAPGVDILSTSPGGGYSMRSGTSMAAAHLSGSLALVWSERPDWTYQQVLTQVLNTTTRLATLRGKVATAGRLHVGNAMAKLAAPGNPAKVIQAVPIGPTPSQVQKIQITFDGAIVPETFTPVDVRLTGPSGSLIAPHSVSAIPETSDKSFFIHFPIQGTPGTYSLEIGPDVMDRTGQKISPWKGTFVLPPGSASSERVYTANSAVSIPKRGTGESSLVITDPSVISNLQVRVSLTHPRVGDLRIYLEGPDGSRVMIFNRAGGLSADLRDTRFSDQASQGIGTGKGPFTGAYRPHAALSAFRGKSTQGTWKLIVEDTMGQAPATLLNWSLYVQPVG